MISDFLWSSSGFGFDKGVNTSNAEKKNQSECSNNEMQGDTFDNEDDISNAKKKSKLMTIQMKLIIQMKVNKVTLLKMVKKGGKARQYRCF